MKIITKFENDKIVKNILHLSDIHIRTGNNLFSRYLEYLDVIKKLLNKLKDHNFENTIIVITGDIFHNKNLIESHGIELFNKLITGLTAFTDVYLIRGNHDYRQDNIDNIDLISALINNSNYKNLHYLDKTGLYEIGDILIGLVAIQDTLVQGDTSGRVEELPQFPWSDKEYKKKIALFHGIIVTNDNNIYKGSINIKWMEQYDFGIFGDIHKQELYNSKWNNDGYYEAIDNDNIMWGYSGSLIQQNFGETINKHGYLIWNIENHKVFPYDIENKHIYINIFKKNNKLFTKITNDSFKNVDIELNEFFTDYNSIEKVSIKTKNVEHSDLIKILQNYDIEFNTITKDICNDKLINSYEQNNVQNISNEDNTENIQQYNSLKTWYEFVENKKSNENREILDELNWKNIIEHPESLLIKTHNIPESIFDKVNKKNMSINKNITKYNTSRDNEIKSNELKLLYLSWDWVLCYKDGCFFNFINMENNVMLLNAHNGFGKSSFFEIICFGIFGTSIPSRNNKQFSSSIICNKKPKNNQSNIKLLFNLNQKEYLIVRNFSHKSTDKTKLEQKAELYSINKTGGIDNLILINSGITAINNWIETNIGSISTFFQSCMHTQNSDNDLFSLSFNDQKKLMDQSLSLNSINVLTTIFKDSSLNYSNTISHTDTLLNELEINHTKVDKIQLSILDNECTIVQDKIEDLDNEIEGIKFPSHIDINNFELDDNIIRDKINEYIKLIGKKNFKNINEISELNGEILSILKSFTETFKYYSIEYDSNWIYSSRNISCNNISDNIRTLCKGMLSRNIPKKKEITKQYTLINENLKRLQETKQLNKDCESDKLDESCECDINDKEKLENEKIEIEKELIEIQKNIRCTQEKINNINVGETKEDLVKLIEKWDKFSKRLDKKKEQLKVNQECLKFFEDNLTIISKNEEESKNIEKQIKEINENDYPFNPNCECCMKQPWKIQLNNLEKSLLLKENNISSFKKKIEDKETELNELKIDDIRNNIGKLEKWFNTYNQLKQNEKGCQKQLVLIEKREQLLHMNKNNYNTIDELNIKLDKINEKLTLIDEKINFDLWISKKEKNEKDKKDYEEFEKNILNNWKELQEYKSYLGDIIKDYENDKLNKENLEYWKTLLELKPKWITYIEKKEKLKKKRKYHHNITNKYLNYRKSYEIYEKECLKIKNYKDLLKTLKLKLKGVDILIDIFNDYRIWLYKEKLFPLILNKLNLIISNMSNDDEELKLDISWSKDVFNWFIIHNGNKVIIDKASGYQKFIIDLSMRITLSSIGVSSLKCNQLFIDEGFSSCDQNHLSKIPSFLNSLLPIYNSILLVSHIQDIKNSSSSSYDIQRDNNLSIIDYGNKNNNITNMIKTIKKKK